MATPSIKLRFLLPQFWLIWFTFLLGWIIAKLPYSWGLSIGKGIGWIMRKLGKKRRFVTQRNIEVCFPNLSAAEQQQLLIENYQSLGIAVVEIALAYWGSSKKLAGLTHISGLEHIEQANRQGRGVFLMASHMTSLELCLRLFAEAQPCSVLYKPSHNPLMEAVTFNKRARYATPIPSHQLKPFLDYVEQGGVAIYLADQHYGTKNSVFAPFFKIWCATIARTPEFVTQTNAVVLPTLFGRREDGYYIEVQPPIDYPTGNPVADATRLNQIAEQNIRLYPSQYLWQHRRFKHVAEGEKPVYD